MATSTANRIDAALEQLVVLDAASCHSELTGGRPSTLWSATAGEEQVENEVLEADLDQLVAGKEGTFSALFLAKRRRAIPPNLVLLSGRMLPLGGEINHEVEAAVKEKDLAAMGVLKPGIVGMPSAASPSV